MASLAVTIRSITPKDSASYHRCLDSVARERKFLGFVEAPPPEGVNEFISSVILRNGIQLVAVDDAQVVVGWCTVLQHQYEGFRHAGELGMGVHAGFRGKGIGRRLANEAICCGWDAGLERIELDVFSSNFPAIRLYETLGFAVEGRKRRARKLDGSYDDLLAMAIFSPEHI
ncbi:MAG: GNAT family N-acetyltransferase [Gemmatimonadales bacterium]